MVSNIIDSDVTNKKSGRTFNLSYVDKILVAHGLVYGFSLSSTAHDLVDFVEQEFDMVNNYPLHILNSWLKSGVINFNSSVQAIIEDWNNTYEPAQPRDAISEFERLTKSQYSGS